MPVLDCVNAVEIVRTPRVAQLEGLFDLEPCPRSERRIHVELPIENEPWSIGLIVGPSGSGKTTVARAAFGSRLIEHYDWPPDRAVVDAFPAQLSIKEITATLAAIGFGSPPSWLRPFRCLSSGEQFRVQLARALAENAALVAIDEYSSCVSRAASEVISTALARYIRARGRQLVAVTCHEDVKEWLRPDWQLRLPECEFRFTALAEPSSITLRVERVHHTAWARFRSYHYLSGSLNRGAICFVGRYRGQPVAFASCLYQPGRGGGYWREHRTVCLPDYQGIGIGNTLSEYVAALMGATGKDYHATTSNPALIRHRLHSTLWKLVRPPSLNRKNRNEWRKGYGFARSRSTLRLTAGFQFIGPARVKEARFFGVV